MDRSIIGIPSSAGSPGGRHIPAFLLSFVEKSIDAIVALNSQGQITYWNPSAERMFGWMASEALGNIIADLFRPADGAQGDAEGRVQSPLGRDQFVQGERLVQRKEGPSFWVEYTIHMVFDEDSQLPGHVVVFHDITEHKHTEKALRENEQRFLSMADAAPVMIWMGGTDKLCTWFNKPWLDFVGRELEQEIGNGWAENIHPDDFERNLQAYSAAFDTRQPFSMEYRLKRCDGEYRWLLDSGVPFYGPSNEFKGYIGSCIDITERKQMEEALRKSEERFHKAFHTNPNAIVISHIEDGRIETVNDTFVRFFGYSNEEVIGKTSTELGMFLNPADLQEAIRRVEKENSVRDFELDVWLRSGEIRNVNLSVELISIRDENMMLTTIQDITLRKRDEKTLARQRELLQGVFENIPVLLVIWEPALKQFTLNQHAEDVLGWTIADVNNGDFMSKAYPDPAYRAEVSAYMQSLDGGFREWMTTAKNGECIPIDWANIRLADKTMIGIGVDLRDRKRAEESLRAKTEEIETLLQVSPIAFFVAYDPECRHITANPAGYRLVELPVNGKQNVSKSAPEEEQPAYRVFRDGVELDSQDMPMQVAARLGVEVFEESLELRFEDGSHKYFYAYARPLIGENGKSRGAVAAMLDITERKRMEREIESMARFPQENPNPVLRIHANGVIAFANAASDKLLRLWDRAVGERVPESERKLISQTLESGMAVEQEVDCAESIYSLIYTPIADSGYVNIYGRDITERKQADVRLRESERRFRSLANTVPSIVWTAAPDGRILFSNEYWHKYTGSGYDQTGRTWTDFLHPDDKERSALEWTHATETVTDYLIETRIRRHDGQYRWFQARALPVRDEVGNVTVWYGVSMDIHDRVEAVHALRESQQQLQFLNESLEQKVNEQTAEVRRLTSNLTKAEQRERHRIAHILHEDLQQRLYAVKMQLSFLLDKGEPEIESGLSEADKQLNEILALTRYLTVELSPPILRDEGLTQALTWLAAQMYEKQGLQIEIQAEESFAMADEAIQVLLFNCVRELLFNIVKHAGISRAVVVMKRSNADLTIEVRDEGKGFNVAALMGSNRNDDEDDHKQWSFGLPTLRHQLGLLGGQMDIQSEPDAGTRIVITIPYS